MLFLIGMWELQEGGPQKAELDTLDLGQGWATLVLDVLQSLTPNIIKHLNNLINVFKTTRKLERLELELNSPGQWPSKNEVAQP